MTEPLNLNNEIVIYQSEDGKTQLDVKLEGGTVWLSQSQMSELFQTDRTVINRHIKNIYKSGELDEKATCEKNAQVRLEGNRTVTRNIPYYYRMTIKIEGNLLTYKTTNEVKTRTLPLNEIAAVGIRKKRFYSVLTITTKPQTEIRLYLEQPEQLQKALIGQ